jgi:hypothetical protein
MYDDHTDTMSIIAIIHMITTLLVIGNFLGGSLGVVGTTVGVGGRVGTTGVGVGGRVVPIVGIGEIINGVELILVVFDIYLYKIYL